MTSSSSLPAGTATAASRRALDARASGLMVVLCLIWGLQQVALKATAADIAPIFQIALRSGAAALLVALLMRWRGERLTVRDGTGWPGLWVGLLFGVEFLFVGEGLRHTSASHMVVFLYTAPVFVALVLHFRLPTERLGVWQWVGIGLAFAGIVRAFWGAGAGTHSTLWGDFLGLLAGLSWAATTVVIRCSRLASANATQTLLYQLVGAFVLLAVAAAASDQTHVRFTPLVWASLAYHTLAVSFASFLVWFWLLRQYLASRLGVFSFLSPLMGVLLGVWLLDEPLEPGFMFGALGVLLGIVLVNAGGWLAQAFAARPNVQ